ncbi:tyrosine-type recombinase/integrase [Pseudomonas sp. W5-01]
MADVLKMDERDITGGYLSIRQNKTAAMQRMEVAGQLEEVLTRISARKAALKVRSTKLIVTVEGAAMTTAILRKRFDDAREAAGVPKADFQMRDLRAKAGTDKAESSGDILQAKDQLGHTTVVMTEHYIRKRKGKKITSTK